MRENGEADGLVGCIVRCGLGGGEIVRWDMPVLSVGAEKVSGTQICVPYE